MSRWADTFAALSRAHDTVDTPRHNPKPPPECRNESTVSHPPPSRKWAVEIPLREAGKCKPCTSTRSWSEAENERVPIEHEGNVPRAWAEGLARLDPTRPPGDVPAKRWLVFLDDIGRFLDGPFCAVAAALGWGPSDLFGCDRDRPFARIDRAGLLWLLNGDRLVALTENTATIGTQTGARQTYRRKPNDPGRVLAWELAE